MNQDNFKNCILGFAKIRGLDITPEYIKFAYQNLKDKLTDEFLRNACGKLTCMSNDQYFQKYKGKLPAINDWLDACGYREPTKEDKETIAMLGFVDKSLAYIERDFLFAGEIDKFQDNLTENERNVLRRFGGISELYKSHRAEKYSRSINNIRKDLEKSFRENYKHENNVKMIEGTTKMKELIASSVKRIEQ